MKQRVVSFFVVMAITLSFLPVITHAASFGVCGDNLTWEFDHSSETLTISGTGEMNTGSPWYEHRSVIRHIVIEDGVTNIEGYAFHECSALTSVTIGNDVTVIENAAFSNCNHLTSVTLGNSLKTLSGFDSCSGLLSITIPESVTSIDMQAFYNCINLKSIKIPDSVISISCC